jgi:hypothetical protein
MQKVFVSIAVNTFEFRIVFCCLDFHLFGFVFKGLGFGGGLGGGVFLKGFS